MSLKNAIIAVDTPFLEQKIRQGTYIESISKIASRHGNTSLWNWIFSKKLTLFQPATLNKLALRLHPEEFWPMFSDYYRLCLEKGTIKYNMAWARLCSIAIKNGEAFSWTQTMSWANYKPLDNRHCRDIVAFYIQHLSDDEFYQFASSISWSCENGIKNPHVLKNILQIFVRCALTKPGRLKIMQELGIVKPTFESLIQLCIHKTLSVDEMQEIKSFLKLTDDAWAACILILVKRNLLKKWYDDNAQNATYAYYADWWKNRLQYPEKPPEEDAIYLDKVWYTFHFVLNQYNSKSAPTLEYTLRYMEDFITFVQLKDLEQIDIF